MRRQSGLNVCGPYSLAFAKSICHGDDQTAYTYNQRSFTNLFSMMLPVVNDTQRRKKCLRVETYKLYCTCHRTDTGKAMIMSAKRAKIGTS